MAVHRFGVDAPRAADAPQIGEQPLQAWLESGCVGVRFLEAQAFEAQTWASKALGDAVFGFVVGEDDNFHARLEQHPDDVALQEVNDCHAMISGDENFLGH